MLIQKLNYHFTILLLANFIIMGNSIKTEKNIENAVKEVYYGAAGVLEEYQQFINNDDGKTTDNTHINGGVSSGVGSSCHFTYQGVYTKLWYDISFLDLIRGRINLIQKWIEGVNNYRETEMLHLQNLKYESFDDLDNMENLQKYVTQVKTKKQEITAEDLANINKIPKGSRNRAGKEMTKNFKNLMSSIGFPNYKPFLKSLIALMKEKEGRCTSDLLTFLRVLKKDKILEEAEDDKQFYVYLSFTHTKPSHKILYKKEKDKIEEEIRKKHDKPVVVVYQDGMKEGDTIRVKYDLVKEEETVKKDFDWVISKGFLKNHNIGDKIEIRNYNLPDDLGTEIMRNTWDIEEKATKKINKPIEMKGKYNISFNIDNIENFQKQFTEIADKFVQETNIFKAQNGFGEYKLY